MGASVYIYSCGGSKILDKPECYTGCSQSSGFHRNHFVVMAGNYTPIRHSDLLTRIVKAFLH